MSEKNKVSADIIGELLLGELPFWRAGVCSVEAVEGNIIVNGEGDVPVGGIKTSEYRTQESIFEDGTLVVDCGAVAEEVNELIREEHEQL